MRKQLFLKLALVVFLIQSASCIWIQVQENVDYPESDFNVAFERVETLTLDNPEREGEASEVHIMVYDGSSRDYVNLIIPVSLIEATESFIPMEEIQSKSVTKDIDLQKLIRNFWDLGPGLIVHVEDAESEAKVLVWLE